jgi:hypothetical protein
MANHILRIEFVIYQMKHTKINFKENMKLILSSTTYKQKNLNVRFTENSIEYWSLRNLLQVRSK